jgi:DNA sulfur modification protein DndB
LDILYDRRGAISHLTVKVGEQVPVFRGKVEMDQMSLSARSSHLVTLSSLYDANGQLVGKLPDDRGERELNGKTQVAVDFWNEATKCIDGWAEVANNEK